MGNRIERTVADEPPHISLRFVGGGVRPSNTRCKDVASLIVAAEELVKALMEDEVDIDDQFSLSLIDIEDQSLGLKFSWSGVISAFAAWGMFAASINKGRIDELPDKAKSSLEEIVKFVRKKQCIAELYSSENSIGAIASITADITLPHPLKLRGGSSLIGEVLQVGGKEPKVKLKLADGKTLSCDTTNSIARQLGGKLYEIVVCKGVATWDARENVLVQFSIKEIRGFSYGSTADAFSELAAVMPTSISSWDDKTFNDSI